MSGDSNSLIDLPSNSYHVVSKEADEVVESRREKWWLLFSSIEE